MDSDYNTERPLIMHIDLNSCFASIEQQARPLLRGRPVAVVNRRTENATIVTASYEAKACGVKVGMRLKEASRLAPGLIAVESDPPKYRYVYRKLLAIMGTYSPHVVMKSIDEGVMDFHGTVLPGSLADIGYDIKRRLKDEVGCAMRCNVGIGPNRFLAKTAASLHKPDGFDTIDHTNLRSTLAELTLTDLTGIAQRYEARLNAVGVYTPLEFLDASSEALRTSVFKSVVGEEWYRRLRGYEVDDRTFGVKTIGRQYVLESRDLPRSEVIRRLHHLCESVGYRLRSLQKAARGVLVYARIYDRQRWHRRSLAQLPFFSDKAIYAQAALLFTGAPKGPIREIGISCYHLEDGISNQLTLFGDELACEQRVAMAVDTINQRFGDRTIHAAGTLGTDFYVKQKVPFGSTRYL